MSMHNEARRIDHHHYKFDIVKQQPQHQQQQIFGQMLLLSTEWQVELINDYK